MKIDNYNPNAVFLRPQNESSVASPKITKDGEDFAALMESEKASASSPDASKLLSGLSGEKAASAAFLSQSSLAQLQIARLQLEQGREATDQEVTQQIEEALSLLESYAVALGDPKNTLKDLAPMAEELSLSADALNNLTKGLKAGNPLREIADETAAVAAVESLKFTRGAFVA